MARWARFATLLGGGLNPRNSGLSEAQIKDLNNKYDIITMFHWCDHYDGSAYRESCEEVTKLKAALDGNLAELEDNAQKMRDKEQSMENKLLGAAGMGLTGAGLSQALSAGAEQQADEAAELDMAAYLATMHCNYAPGKNVQGGEKEVELPGGNELMTLKTEYMKLAADLKIRKQALGLQPGIESEEILDSATSGLYDDVALGKTDGAYTSLSRALTDENSEDAKEWTAQKEETAKDKKTGTTMAVVGAVGSAIANIAINKNGPKESSEEILARREQILSQLDTQLEKMINDCNKLIEKQRARFANYNGPDADKIKELVNRPLLNGLADIDKLKGHPICY